VLTPAERRGALVVVGLFLIGASVDLWSAMHPRLRPFPDHGRGDDPAPGGGTVVSPSPEPPGPASDPPGAAAPTQDQRGAGRLDLNAASEAELDRLPGIGPVLARRIVEHRARHGRFRRVEELLAVPGVGPGLLERLRPVVRAGN
jgi:competence ComEA-like helix-hairpin-helix protein